MNNQMFASVLHLDRKAVRVLKITDPYSIHRVIYSIFEDIRTEQEKYQSISSGFIYSDEGGSFNNRKILVVSNRPPTSNSEKSHVHIVTKTINPSFLNYENYRFKVTVNPCKRNNKSKKLIPVKGRESIAQWFIQRSEQSWGFCIEDRFLQINDIEVICFKGKNKRNITISRAKLEGVLRVTDQNKFIQSFKKGIGRARAFGCGLLQIVPL